MKKRFVAKQVGVLSLTAVLAGMPAVNVLAEDVYQEKVGEVQTEAEKALLRAALNVSFVTEYGENVGNTYVESDLLWPWDSYTFKLGTDYQFTSRDRSLSETAEQIKPLNVGKLHLLKFL